MSQAENAERLAAYTVWDPAVRAAHWSMAALFVWLALSGHFGWWPRLHLWAGYLLLGVLIFRLAWGFCGGDSARFSEMLASLRTLGSGLRGLGERKPGYAPGHNPVGALSVLLMLALLFAQSITGLFFESWGEVRGPLAERVSRDTVLALTDLHGLLLWPLLALTVIHVAAGFHHLLWKGENRLGAIFVHGRLKLPSDPGLRMRGRSWALMALIVALLIVAAVVWFGPIA